VRPTCGKTIVFFVLLIPAATVLLGLPGVLPAGRLSLPDAVFLAISAVTLTGLTPVAVSALTPFGQAVLLLVFQVAGILLIASSTLLLACPGAHGSKATHRVVPERWLAIEELNPARLVLAITLSTLLIEAVGAMVLYLRFRANAAVPDPLFAAVFHAASAFCNAGFSTLPGPDGPGGLASAVPITLMTLSVLGGPGFVVLRALFLWATRQQRLLGFHSRLVLAATALLLVSGATLYYLFERLPPGAAGGKPDWLQALFQAAAVRTAGFDLGAHRPVTTASKLLSAMLMLIGGAPGSAAD
jgi:trk system potassium uptake protein TrkH